MAISISISHDFTRVARHFFLGIKKMSEPSVVELQARWDKIRVANVYDTLDKMGYPNQCLDLGIRPLFPHRHLAGQVITVRGSAYPVPRGEEGTGWTGNYFSQLRQILY